MGKSRYYLMIVLMIFVSEIYSEWDIKARLESGEVLVVGHRGLWRSAPENSMEAVEAAIKAGLEMVEVDVRLTKDSVLILMHDESLERTTNGRGLVRDQTYAEISRYNLKNGLGRLTRYKIPRLADVLEASRSRIYINIDKSEDYLSKVYDVMSATGSVEGVLLKGRQSYEEFIDRNGDLKGKINYMPILRLDERSDLGSVRSKVSGFDSEIIELIFERDDLRVLDSLENLGKRVWVNTLWGELCGGHSDNSSLEDAEGNWGWLIDRGVDVIQSDRPLVLKNYIRDKKN